MDEFEWEERLSNIDNISFVRKEDPNDFLYLIGGILVEYTGRPDRETVIGDDDLLDLHRTLSKDMDVLDFIKEVS